MNEQEKFLDELKDGDKGTADILEVSLNPTGTKETEEKVPDELKNRRHRRLEEKLQAEREANIAMSERLKVMSEVKELQGSEEAGYLKSIEKIYGTDSPEAIAATTLLKQALTDVEESATKKALDKFRQEQREIEEEVSKEEKTLDAIVENIEDTYNVDLSSSKATEVRKGFFRLMEKLSPKDSDGNILNYADPDAVWEEYQERLVKKNNNTAKELASRSMAQSSSGATSKLQDDSTVRFLKEQGIL